MRRLRHPATGIILSLIAFLGATISIGWSFSPRQYSDLTSPFYIEPMNDFKQVDRILRSDEPRQRLIRLGNTIYVTNQENLSPEKNQKFFIFKRKTNKMLDDQVLAHRIGAASFEKKYKNVMLMRVTKANGSIKNDDWVVPAKKLDQKLPKKPAYTNQQVVGKIIDLISQKKYTAQYYSIVIDIGRRDGLKPGTVFDIYRELENVDDYELPSEEIGTGFAYHVSDNASIALVTHSRLPISKGLEIVTRKQPAASQSPKTIEGQTPETTQPSKSESDSSNNQSQQGPITTDLMPRCDRHSDEKDYSIVCFTPKDGYDSIHLYIQFAYDSAKLSASAKRTIDQFVDALKTTDAFVPFTLNGYASMGVPGQPFKSYNLELSEKRADVVRNYMLENGINSDMINMQAHGWHNPLVPNASSQLRHVNQRVSTTTKVR